MMTGRSRNFDKILVQSSQIHGSGVFAKRLIRAHEVAVFWENTREIDSAEYAALSSDERQYIDIQDGKYLLVGDPERYVNHSCDANTVPGDLCDIATRDIHEGEEISADYGGYFIPSGQFQCRCGSPKCRGLVKGTK